MRWAQGDLFVLPSTSRGAEHTAAAEGEDVALYWVSDEPLMRYLGVSPVEKKFEPTLFTKTRMVGTVELLKHEQGVAHRNRLGACGLLIVFFGSYQTMQCTRP